MRSQNWVPVQAVCAPSRPEMFANEERSYVSHLLRQRLAVV